MLFSQLFDRGLRFTFSFHLELYGQDILRILNLSNCEFYAPSLKGLPGASSNRFIRLSVCLKFRPAYKQSAIFKVWVVIQLPNLDCKFIYGFNTLLWHPMPLGVEQSQNVGLRNFCHILTLLPLGASVFHKHMSSSNKNYLQNISVHLLYILIRLDKCLKCTCKKKISRSLRKTVVFITM